MEGFFHMYTRGLGPETCPYMLGHAKTLVRGPLVWGPLVWGPLLAFMIHWLPVFLAGPKLYMNQPLHLLSEPRLFLQIHSSESTQFRPGWLH